MQQLGGMTDYVFNAQREIAEDMILIISLRRFEPVFMLDLSFFR